MVRYTPECPFCGRIISQPAEAKTEFGTVTAGSCECGTIYVCDLTGHNTGEAYMEALALARGNWQINDMGEDVDYETCDIDYDIHSHQRVFSRGLGSPAGRLVFVKLKMPQEACSLPPRNKRAAAPQPTTSGKASTRESNLNRKDRLKGLLELRAYDEVADMSMEDKGVIRLLISLSYDRQDVTSWRAIEAVGVISRAFSKDSKERLGIVRDTVRRLLWSMGEESGGIGWSSPELLGEIVTGEPDAFNDIVPILWSFRDEDMFRAGILWAMGRIAAIRPDLVGFTLQDLPGMLEDKNPAVRGYAIWLMGVLGPGGSGNEQISRFLDDSGPVPFYKEGELIARTVAEVAGEVLHKQGK